jgi:ribonuclease HI
MPWRPARFKGTSVWAEVQGDDLKVDAGRVAIRYSSKPGAKVYRAGASRVELADEPPVDLDAGSPVDAASSRSVPAAASPAPPDPTRIFPCAFTDGASRGNPGPAGSGVLVELADGTTLRAARSLGVTTNNVAELTAIQMALELLQQRDVARDRPVVVWTDSSYALGVLTKGWKARANQRLVGDIRAALADWPALSIQWVRGHAGSVGNEEADRLANLGADGQSFVTTEPAGG